MLSSDGRPAASLLTLLGLNLGAYLLSIRFYTSASFERPVTFTIVTLLLSAFVLRRRQRWQSPSSHGYPLAVLRPPAHHGRSFHTRGLKGLSARTVDLVRRLNPPFRMLLICIVARTLLFWFTLRNAQCSIRGMEAFLPFLIAIVDNLTGRNDERLPNSKADWTPRAGISKIPTLSGAFFASIAFAQGICVIWTLNKAIISTGAVCPLSWSILPATPFFQVVMCALDAIILVRFSHLRRIETSRARDASKFMGNLFIAAALSTAAIAFLPILIDWSAIHVIRLNLVEVRDLLLDGCVTTVVVLCVISPLADVRPATLVLLPLGLGMFGFRLPGFAGNPLVPHASNQEALIAVSVTAVLIGILEFAAKPPEHAARLSKASILHRLLKVAFVGIVGICAAWTITHPAQPSEAPLPATVNKLYSDAEFKATTWERQAAASKTLEQAVTEYQRRYGLPPPPNFDKWYEFAKISKSSVIDSFDQIYNDLLPFWGAKPLDIRAQTEHLLMYANLGMGGLRIRKGIVEQSPHIPDSKRWMAQSMERMIQPFAKWLPDMDFAINLGDECRVTVPYSDKETLLKQADETRSRMTANANAQDTKWKGWPERASWPDGWLDLRGDFDDANVKSSYFTNNVRKPILYDWVAPTCPPGSPARNSRWWDSSTACPECIAPHSAITRDGAVLADAAMADDVCHQPDLAYLSGFMRSPSVVGTSVLFPVFSQSRAGGFSDILFPSPWNFKLKSESEYEEAKDMAWSEKTNALFWRGSSTDGIAWDGSWTGFLRSRLVNEGYQQPAPSEKERFMGVNVSFIGEVSNAYTADYWAELATFTQWGKAVAPPDQDPAPDEGPLPAATEFDENWRYRHLMDMDGAGFSSRFIPFLQSNSVVYRAALFKTWFDERIQPWHHYVPVDVRLGRGFWAMLRYLSSAEERKETIHTGDDIAQRIAYRGQEWAAQALRAEDMQVYMFRLLLEWGRVTDDERETMGYVKK